MFTAGLGKMVGSFLKAFLRPPALRLKKDVRHAAIPRAVEDGKYADHREHGQLRTFRREGLNLMSDSPFQQCKDTTSLHAPKATSNLDP